MRILMRNTVFKTAALAGLFSCVLVFWGVFSGTTDFVHATHDQAPTITAGQVTEGNLEQFVQGAVDAYYIDFIMKHHCDFTGFTATVPGFGMLDGATINNLLPNLPTAQIKAFIPQFGDLDMGDYCDLSQPFEDVFGRTEGNWKSGSIYLFVMDDGKELLFHGDDEGLEGDVLEAIDEGDRDVGQLIVDEADDPMNNGIVKYCWDDPAVDTDDINDNDDETAPGDSLKVSYVVDPFEYLRMNQPMDSPGVIFGSGIYPGPDPDEFPECDGNGMADGGMGGEPEPTEPEPTEPEPTEPEPTDPEEMRTSVSGGGCAIAGGGDSTSRNDALNLLLMVSTLFLAVSFGNRAAGRRNAIRS